MGREISRKSPNKVSMSVNPSCIDVSRSFTGGWRTSIAISGAGDTGAIPSLLLRCLLARGGSLSWGAELIVSSPFDTELSVLTGLCEDSAKRGEPVWFVREDCGLP